MRVAPKGLVVFLALSLGALSSIVACVDAPTVTPIPTPTPTETPTAPQAEPKEEETPKE